MFTLAGQNVSDMNETMDSEGMLTDSADQMNKMNAEVHVLEEEYQKDLLELEKVLLSILSPNIVLFINYSTIQWM